MSPTTGLVSLRSAEAKSTHSTVREPGHTEISYQFEQNIEARSSLGDHRSEQSNQSRFSEPMSPLSSYRRDRYRRITWQTTSTEPERMNKCLRILLQIPLLICLCTCLVGVKLVSSPCGPLPRARQSQSEGLGAESAGCSQTNTASSSWPHRLKNNWVPLGPQGRVQEESALRNDPLELSKAVTNAFGQGRSCQNNS